MFGGYGNIVKSDYKKPFKIFFESPLRPINPFSSSLRQNSEIHIRLYSLPPSVPKAMLLSISNAKSISTTVS
jgi:hypothetical protein